MAQAFTDPGFEASGLPAWTAVNAERTGTNYYSGSYSVKQTTAGSAWTLTQDLSAMAMRFDQMLTLSAYCYSHTCSIQNPMYLKVTVTFDDATTYVNTYTSSTVDSWQFFCDSSKPGLNSDDGGKIISSVTFEANDYTTYIDLAALTYAAAGTINMTMVPKSTDDVDTNNPRCANTSAPIADDAHIDYSFMCIGPGTNAAFQFGAFDADSWFGLPGGATDYNADRLFNYFAPSAQNVLLHPATYSLTGKVSIGLRSTVQPSLNVLLHPNSLPASLFAPLETVESWYDWKTRTTLSGYATDRETGLPLVGCQVGLNVVNKEYLSLSNTDGVYVAFLYPIVESELMEMDMTVVEKTARRGFDATPTIISYTEYQGVKVYQRVDLSCTLIMKKPGAVRYGRQGL